MDKTANHQLSPMRCPHSLAEVDLFGPGAQEHWYEAYPICTGKRRSYICPARG